MQEKIYFLRIACGASIIGRGLRGRGGLWNDNCQENEWKEKKIKLQLPYVDATSRPKYKYQVLSLITTITAINFIKLNRTKYLHWIMNKLLMDSFVTPKTEYRVPI